MQWSEGGGAQRGGGAGRVGRRGGAQSGGRRGREQRQGGARAGAGGAGSGGRAGGAKPPNVQDRSRLLPLVLHFYTRFLLFSSFIFMRGLYSFSLRFHSLSVRSFLCMSFLRFFIFVHRSPSFLRSFSSSFLYIASRANSSFFSSLSFTSTHEQLIHSFFSSLSFTSTHEHPRAVHSFLYIGLAHFHLRSTTPPAREGRGAGRRRGPFSPRLDPGREERRRTRVQAAGGAGVGAGKRKR